jgi:hypothetical protein
MVRSCGQITGLPQSPQVSRRLEAFSSFQSLRRPSLRLTLVLDRLLWIALLVLPVSLYATPPPSRSDTPPPPKLEERIPVAPLGYRPPGQLYMLTRISSSSLDFIDSTRLLFTFHTAKLMKRERDAAWSDDDQMIHAEVLDLPGGQVDAAADWRMHDRSRYIWPLGGGRFLVRQGNDYSTVDASLTLKQWLSSPTGVLATEVSPDGKLLVTEDEYERHTPEEHQKLVEEANASGVAPPSEDALINLVDVDTKTVLGRIRVEMPAVVPIVRSGYLVHEESKDASGYLIEFFPFGGKEVTLGSVRSTCQPRETFLNDQTAMIESCGPNTTDTFLDTWTIDGKRLWSGRRDGHALWPTFALAQDGRRFAIGLLRVMHEINLDDSLDDENVKEQVVQVFDVATGALLVSVTASPILSAGQNFALSSDGNHLAVLHDGAIEVYAVPSAPNTPNASGKKDK